MGNHSMTPTEISFEAELEIFRREVDSAIQFFYASLAVNGYAFKNKPALAALNDTPLFWNTVKGARQASTWMTLGRIFDQTSSHNVDKIVQLAQRHRAMFTKAALASRKRQASPSADKWLPQYLANVHEPTADELRRLRKHVAKRRRIYEDKYKAIRDKLYAHKEVVETAEVSKLFAKTTIRDVEAIIIFLKKLHLTLWELFFNGQKPVLRPIPYSASRMLKQLDERIARDHVQQIIIDQTVRALSNVQRGARTRHWPTERTRWHL